MARQPRPAPAGPLVFISAAEPSADLHAAGLIRAVQRIDPSVRFVGVAGAMMQEAGCTTIADMTTHAAMLSGAFRLVPKALATLRRSKEVFFREPIDLAVVIDSPTLNLPMCKHARSAGVPVLYYIAPQLWAWGKGRMRRVQARVDRLAVILPFEEQLFRDQGIKADYVGHPLFDTLAQRLVDKEKVRAIRQQRHPIVAILPGSRAHVVSEVLPGQLQVARAIVERFTDAGICVSIANRDTRPLVERLTSGSGLPLSLHHGENSDILSAADLALIASGTATLEAAYYHTPMIVMYNATRLGYQLVGRWFIQTRHLSLVNILAGRQVVPEFMPYYKSTVPIVAKALEMLESEDALKQMRAELAAVIDPIVRTGAADNAARIVMQMLGAPASRT